MRARNAGKDAVKARTVWAAVTAWTMAMARQVAPSVRDFTIVTRSNDGTVTVGKSYTDRRVAFAQRTRLENAAGCNVYVVTLADGRLKVFTGPKARPLAIQVSP
jgi:hypothetical protein